MAEIAGKPGFLPEATWLVIRSNNPIGRLEYCGTVQGVRDERGVGAIQNLGVVGRLPSRRAGHESAAAVAGRISPVGRPSRLARSDRPKRPCHPPLPAGWIHHGQSRLQNHRGGIRQVTHRIFSHTYPNGLVLVAEPTAALQSAAFTFLVPAGCVYDPENRGGLSSFTCEMSLRGAGGRDSRQFILDLDNLGVERAEGVSSSHASYSGATVAENLPKTLAIYADLLRRPHLPEDQLEASRLAMLQELRAVEDEPGQKVMIELRRRHYPEPWGLPAQGDEASIEATAIDDIRLHFRRCYRPNGTILGVAGRVDWQRLKDAVGELLGDWPAGGDDPIVETPRPCRYEHLPYDSQQTHIGVAYASVPYRHPDYFQAWGRGRVERRHERPAVYRGPRAPRPVLQRSCLPAHALASRRGVLLLPAPAPSGARDLGRDPRRASAFGRGNHRGGVGSAEGANQERPDHAAGIQFRPKFLVGLRLVSPRSRRAMEEVGQLVDGLSSRSINAYLAEHPPADFTVVTLGSRALEVS